MFLFQHRWSRTVTGEGNCCTLFRVFALNIPRSTQSTRLGYKSPFIKPFLNKTNQKVYKRKRYRKRITCFICPQEKKKCVWGDNTNMLNNKGLFSLFLSTKYKQRTRILRTGFRSDSSPGNPSIGRSKAGVCRCCCFCKCVQTRIGKCMK